MELFAKQGFQGTTTRQIAERACVNEAILFRHFARKEDLYWAVIESKCRGSRGRRELQRTLASSPNPEQALTAVAEAILDRNREDPTRSRLFLYSALENHRLSRRFFRAHLARYYDVVAEYVRGQIRRGEFRRMDPRLAARCFLGMVSHHHQVQELFGGKNYQRFNPHAACATMAQIWCGGMRTRNGRHARSKSTPSDR